MKNIKTFAITATTAISLALASSVLASEAKQDWKFMKSKPESVVDGDYYLTMGVGANFNRAKLSYKDYSKSFNPATSAEFMFGIGKKLNDKMRAGLCVHFMPSTEFKMSVKDGKEKQDVSSVGLMANMFYHFQGMDSKFSPYGMLGLGMMRNSTEDMTYYPTGSSTSTRTISNNKTKTNFAWHVGLGISGKTSGKMIWDLEYRYMDRGKINKVHQGITDVYESYKDSLTSHALMFSVRVPISR